MYPLADCPLFHRGMISDTRLQFNKNLVEEIEKVGTVARQLTLKFHICVNHLFGVTKLYLNSEFVHKHPAVGGARTNSQLVNLDFLSLNEWRTTLGIVPRYRYKWLLEGHRFFFFFFYKDLLRWRWMPIFSTIFKDILCYRWPIIEKNLCVNSSFTDKNKRHRNTHHWSTMLLEEIKNPPLSTIRERRQYSHTHILWDQ